LPALRRTLTDADDALLCVAFVNRKGLNLLSTQLGKLAERCRLLVTSAFGGETTAAALATATALGMRVRVLNPTGGTFHSKLYLARTGQSTVAVLGSPNLTSGLVANIETALVVTGDSSDQAIADVWQHAESLWEHPAATGWTPSGALIADEQFDAGLFEALCGAIPNGTVVPTLSDARPNLVVEMAPHGVYVETVRSRARGSGPQLVPAWMLQLAWDYLQLHGELSNRYLLAEDGLNVKRSSAVCALLARLPAIDLVSSRPIVLQLLR
jgi:HKD family nuclease